jgi:hypothetical protein
MRRAVFTISLPFPNSLPGSQIMEAVKKVAGAEYQEAIEEVIDDNVTYSVGCSSKYPERGIIICVGGGFTDTRIDPRFYYALVGVVSHDWGGVKFACLPNDNHTITATKEFLDKLAAELAATP